MKLKTVLARRAHTRALLDKTVRPRTLEFDFVEVRRPVATLVAVTVASGTTAFCGSAMMPVIAPRFDCARLVPAPIARSSRLKGTIRRRTPDRVTTLLIRPLRRSAWLCGICAKSGPEKAAKSSAT